MATVSENVSVSDEVVSAMVARLQTESKADRKIGVDRGRSIGLLLARDILNRRQFEQIASGELPWFPGSVLEWLVHVDPEFAEDDGRDLDNFVIMCGASDREAFDEGFAEGLAAVVEEAWSKVSEKLS